MRYRIVISFGLLFVSILIGGIGYRSIPQTGLLMSVYGWVKNIETGNSIRRVTISLLKVIEDEKYIFTSEGTSDKNGFYKIKYLEPGIYRFSIETPERGTVYIGFIALGGSNEDYYRCEIKAGENKNLNIFLGESRLPDIRREEFQDGRRIDFTMIFNKKEETRTAHKTTVAKSLETKQVNKDEDKGLKIIQNLNVVPVADNYEIGKEQNLDADYKYILGIKVDYTYDGNRCKFSSPECNYEGFIEIHSFDWIKKKINKERIDKELPPLTDDCIKCLYDCLIVHERTHMDLATDKVKGCWGKFLLKLTLTPVQCEEDCEKLFEQWKKELDDCIKREFATTEPDAAKAQKECEKNCKNKCS